MINFIYFPLPSNTPSSNIALHKCSLVWFGLVLSHTVLNYFVIKANNKDSVIRNITSHTFWNEFGKFLNVRLNYI